MSRNDNGLGRIYDRFDARYEFARRLVEEDSATYVREYRKGVLTHEEMTDLAEQIDALDEIADEYLTAMANVLLTARSRNEFVRCRKRPPVSIGDRHRLPVVFTSEVRPLSGLDSVSLSDSGPHAPPTLTGGPP